VGKVIDFWMAFSDVVIIARRLAREGWRRYRDGSRYAHIVAQGSKRGVRLGAGSSR
jgi:hypothetical protein